MSRFEKLSLQWRVTIMTVLILICCVAVFAIFTIIIARNSFKPVEFDNSMFTENNVSSDMFIESNIPIENNQEIVYTFIDEFSEQALLGYQHSRAVFNSTSIILCIVIIIIGSILVYFLTKKALTPINTLSIQLSSIDEENISERLESKFGDEQIISLTQSFNHVLDRLEDAFERQKLFSANASHELKTPLAVMKAGIQVLKIDEETTLEEYKENAVMMEESVNRLIKVTDNLMLLSFIGEEQPKLNEKINLKNMIESVFEELQLIYSENSVSVECDVNNVLVTGNTMLIYRVIYNLIENAYKYNIKNGFIKVCVKEVDNKKHIEVSNSGEVVPKESLESLFDAFYRLDNSRSHKKGSGLGLSIVKSIINYHKGEVNIESIELGGLKITIVI